MARQAECLAESIPAEGERDAPLADDRAARVGPLGAVTSDEASCSERRE